MVQARSNTLMNARLADVCIGTSAAPTVLPAHYFETVDYHTGTSRCFNVIDGGLVANNPVICTSLVIVCGWISCRVPVYFVMIFCSR